MAKVFYSLFFFLSLQAAAQTKVRIGSNSNIAGGSATASGVDSMKVVADSLKLFNGGTATAAVKIAKFYYPVTPQQGDYFRYNFSDSTWRNATMSRNASTSLKRAVIDTATKQIHWQDEAAITIPVATSFPSTGGAVIRSDIGNGTLWIADGSYWKRYNAVDSIVSESPNYAYSFSGTSQNITTASSTDFAFTQSQAWSVGFWIKATSTTGAFRMGYSTGTARIWDVNYTYSSGSEAFQVEGAVLNTANTGYFYSRSTANKSPNTWYYVVVTFDGTSAVKVYVNGTAETVASNSGTVTSQATGGSFKIGQFASFTSTATQVDNLFIANIELSSAQVASLYNAGSPDPSLQSWYAANGLAYWRFQQNLNDAKTTHSGTATTPQYVTH